MNKIILAISIFCMIPVEAMVNMFGRQYVYKKGGDRRVALADIPRDIFFYNMFPSSLELNEIATLLKKIPLKNFRTLEKKKRIINLMLKNLISLICISQTNKGFNKYLKDEINKRIFLPYVSLNSVNICIGNSCRYEELIVHCRGNILREQFVSNSGYEKDSFTLDIFLKRDNTQGSGIQLRSEKQYKNLYKLCALLLGYVNDDKEQASVLVDIQKQCTLGDTISVELLTKMEDIVSNHYLNKNIVERWSDQVEFGKLIAASYYRVCFSFKNHLIPEAIRRAFCSEDSNDLKKIIQACLPALNISEKKLGFFLAHFNFLSNNKAPVVLEPAIYPRELCFSIRLSGNSNERNIPVDMLHYKIITG